MWVNSEHISSLQQGRTPTHSIMLKDNSESFHLSMFLVSGRKLDQTHAWRSRTCKLHTERAQPEPGVLTTTPQRRYHLDSIEQVVVSVYPTPASPSTHSAACRPFANLFRAFIRTSCANGCCECLNVCRQPSSHTGLVFIIKTVLTSLTSRHAGCDIGDSYFGYIISLLAALLPGLVYELFVVLLDPSDVTVGMPALQL